MRNDDLIPAFAVPVDEILDADANLTPNRYSPAPPQLSDEELSAAREAAWTESVEALGRLASRLSPDLPAFDSAPVPASPVRLGDVAKIFRARAAGPETRTVAAARDLVLSWSAGGLGAQLLKEGEAVDGLHAIVVRPSVPARVHPAWLLVWTKTEAFAAQVQRYAAGGMVRQVSVKDLALFELDIPALGIQLDAARRFGELGHLSADAHQLAAGIDRLRTAEQRLSYARMSS